MTEKDMTDARVKLQQDVYLPVFMAKLAAHGIAPQSEADAENLLKIAAYTAAVESSQVGSASGFIAKAASALEQHLGIGQPTAPKSTDVAMALAQNPAVKAAAATLVAG
jgi:hypothetical protein